MNRLPAAVLVSGVLAVAAPAQQVAPLKRVATEKPIVAKLATFRVGTLTVSADGRRFAYGRKEGSKWVAEVDGKVEASHKDIGPVLQPAYFQSPLGSLPGIKPMIFSGDSQHLAYGASDGNGWFIVRDGQKGKPFKLVGAPVMSRDGQRIAYAAKVEGGWSVVLDGTEGKAYEKVGPPVFSTDGKHVAYAARANGREMMVADGVEGKSFDSLDITSVFMGMAFPHMVIATPVFGADGRLAYMAKQGEQWRVIDAGRVSEPFENIETVGFTLDERRLVVIARKAGAWSVIVDDQSHGAFDKSPAAAFSQDGQHLAIAGKSKDSWSVILDGRTVGTHSDVGMPAFSPDGRRLAYAVKTGKQWAMVVDGTAQKPYLAVTGPVFSPDGSHCAYEAAIAEGRWVVVVDGVEGKEYRGLVKGARVVFDDNTHFHYIVVSGEQVVLVEEEIQAGPTLTAP